MKHKRFFLISLALVCAAALAVPVVGQAGSSDSKGGGRTFYASDDQGQLLSFSEDNPRRLDSLRRISGLPPGVSLKGIDFRPATGDLYGVGSDSVVYRVNPFTAIAVAEGPAFTPGLRGRFLGWDFNPQVDRIRLTSDVNQNQRLHPDDANVVGTDTTSTRTIRRWWAPRTPTRRSAQRSRPPQSCTRSMRSTTRSTRRPRRTTAR
jgi:Domain of unknown function (DUF4394)